MSIVISGGLSDFSNVLAKQLLENGENVVIFHNFNASYNKVLSSIKGNSKLTILNIDNINLEEILKQFSIHNVTRVIDCSLINTNFVELDHLKSASRLLLGITNLLDAIRTYGKIENFTLVSGQGVYGNSKLQDETQPLTPITFNGASQMSVEAMVHSYAVSYRINTIIGRIPNILIPSNISNTTDGFSNNLNLSNAVNGVRLLSKISSFTFENPAEVFNISNNIETNGNGESREAIFTNKKISEKLGFSVQSNDDAELSNFENILPTFLVYGQTVEKLEFVKLLKNQGIPYFESSVDLETTGDANVKEEISRILPSHLVYFSSNQNSFEGNCFTLRSNVSLNLYLPWLLASISDRTAIHFTYFGTNPIFGESSESPETSALAVKTHTDKMLSYFENILQLRVGSNVADSENVGQQNVDLKQSGTNLEENLPNGLDLILNKSFGIHRLVNLASKNAGQNIEKRG